MYYNYCKVNIYIVKDVIILMDIQAKKEELGLIDMTDEEILKYALVCSQEIKKELSSRNTSLNYKSLIDTLGEADKVLLDRLSR